MAEESFGNFGGFPGLRSQQVTQAQQAQQVIPGEDGIVSFGKHRGKSFKDVLKESGYVDWLLQLADEDIKASGMREFLAFCRIAKGEVKEQTPFSFPNTQAQFGESCGGKINVPELHLELTSNDTFCVSWEQFLDPRCFKEIRDWGCPFPLLPFSR